MKIKLLSAFIFFVLGVIRIIDWIIFWETNTEIRNNSYQIFISKYHERFPEYIKPLFNRSPEPAAIISVIILTTAGIIFFIEKNIVFKILAIICFATAFLNLFSLM